jgi:hypothetical protein
MNNTLQQYYEHMRLIELYGKELGTKVFLGEINEEALLKEELK